MINRPEGDFKFTPGSPTFCGDVLPLRGHTLAHATFVKPLPLTRAFSAIKKYLNGIGRPMAAFCGAELRMPEQLTPDGFASLNVHYQALLDKHGLRQTGPDGKVYGTGTRTNVVPQEVHAKPAEASVFGFTFTIPGKPIGGRKPFACSGSGENAGPTRESFIALGDTSPTGMRKKANWVMDRYIQRLPAMGVGWSDITHLNMYCVVDPGSVIASEVLSVMNPNATLGVHWHYARPPIAELEFEVDVRGVAHEIFL